MKTSSEFCGEEHAEQYKRETVGRLLEYAQPLHPASGPIDPIHRLAIMAGEKPPSEEEHWQIQEFVALTMRHRTTPRVPMTPSSPTPPRLHRPRGGEIQPRKIWSPSPVRVLPREGPWSRWFPAEPTLRIPTGRSLSDPSRHRQPATRAEVTSGLRRRSGRGLPAAAPAMCAGVEPSGAAPPGRRFAPAPLAMGLSRTRAAGTVQISYPRPTASTQGFSRISPARGFVPVSAGLAAAPAASGGFALEGAAPAVWHPIPVWLQALPFAPLRRATPSFLSLTAAPRVGSNGSSHPSPPVELRMGWEPALRLPGLPPARKFGRLDAAPVAAAPVEETRLLGAVPVLPTAHYLSPNARYPLPSPAILRASELVEQAVANLAAFASSHTVAPALVLAPALAAPALTGRLVELAPAVERLVQAVSPPALNTWSPAAGLALLRPAGSPFASAPAETVPRPLRSEEPVAGLPATRLLTGSSCAWRGAGDAPREFTAARSTSVNRAVAGEALRLTATAADIVASRAPATAVAQAPLAPPHSAAARLEPRRVALSLPPSGHLAPVMPASAIAATTALAASSGIMAVSRTVSSCDAATRPFVEVRCTVPPAALTSVPATGATPAPAPDSPAAPLPARPAPHSGQTPHAGAIRPAAVPSLVAATPVDPALPPPALLQTQPHPAIPAAGLAVPAPPAPPSPATQLPTPAFEPVETTLPSAPSPAIPAPLPALVIELRHREVPPPLPARRTTRVAEAAFGMGRRAPAPVPSTVPALLPPMQRSIDPPASSSLQPLQILIAAPLAGEPLPAGEPVPRLDVTVAPKPTLRPVAVSSSTDAASVREALDPAQKARPNRWAILIRAARVLWHDALVPFLATRRGKFATVSVLTVFSLFLGLRAPSGPLRGAARAAVQPLAERSYFLSEEGFASGLDAWTNPAQLKRQDDGLVEVAEGLTLYRPSLRRVDYEFSFAGTIRKSALGWVVRAPDPSNYYACKLTWRGKGREKRSVLVRYPVVEGAPAAPEKVVALPFQLEENKVYNLLLTVHGDRITTLIDGRGVDSFSDARLLTGGIGFLAAPGEQALVHSVAVSGNDDTTGRALAWMLGFGRFLGGKAFGS